MKAILCKAFGPPETLVLEDLPSKALGMGQVRIAVHAAGVNFPDVLMIQGKYRFKPPFPFVPGSEVAGEVIETSADVITPKIGDRVMAVLSVGGYADEAIAPAHACFALPERMDYVTAAGFLMAYGTSYYALVQRASLQPGEVLLVHGAAGSAGSAALDIARNLGAKLIATGGSAQKLERIAELYGVEHVINYRTEPNWNDRIKELTMAQGANVVFDAVGGDMLENSLRCVAWDGRVLVVGFASGEVPKVPANLVLFKNASVVGVFWAAWVSREHESNRANFEIMFDWYNQGKLKPIVSHTFPLAQAKDALNTLVQRQVVGKCVITTGRSPVAQGTK